MRRAVNSTGCMYYVELSLLVIHWYKSCTNSQASEKLDLSLNGVGVVRIAVAVIALDDMQEGVDRYF